MEATCMDHCTRQSDECLWMKYREVCMRESEKVDGSQKSGLNTKRRSSLMAYIRLLSSPGRAVEYERISEREVLFRGIHVSAIVGGGDRIHPDFFRKSG